MDYLKKIIYTNFTNINNIPSGKSKPFIIQTTWNGHDIPIIRDKDIEDEFDKPELYTSKYPVILHVHHKLYYENHMAWEYEDSDLITLCEQCHMEVHETSVIPVYTDNGNKKTFTPCTRCHGAGRFPEYKKIEHGVCFRCRGERYEEKINN